MSETWELVQFFPSNGLDRSLHAPVFIGLLLLSFFKETLGWTYAGLVVPGYLATVFLAAPVTGVLVVVESVASYTLSALVGRVLPRTGVWFTFFGRERFLLIIAISSFVRLVVEGGVVPRLTAELGLAHSRELYSLGLVLVPLLANSYWNAGLARAFPRMTVVTALTYLVVSQVLLRFTNFTISRFQVANESVSLAFLESPHAHIILLIGAILGARNNVRYGWDYNGILVPALLAVAWYQPSKVLATVVEALIVYYLSVLLLRVPPFSRLLIVGSRRLLVTFTVGFLFKFVVGELLLRVAPQVQLVDTFGFGYLLPSLLAVKFWDKQKVLRVLMPTLQVSMMAFPLGIAVGYGLRLVSPPRAEALATPRAVQVVERPELALLRGDSAPAPHRTGASFKEAGTYEAALGLAAQARSGPSERALGDAARMHLSVRTSRAGDWVVITPAAEDPNADALGPRLAVRTQRAYGDEWIIVIDRPEVASPLVPIAWTIAERIGAGAVVIRSRLPQVRESDDAFIEQLSDVLEIEHALMLSSGESTGESMLDVAGRIPHGFDPSALERRLGIHLETRFRAVQDEPTLIDDAPRLQLPVDIAEYTASRLLGSAPLEQWQLSTNRELERRLAGLVGTEPGKFTQPSTPEIRVYGELVSRRLRAAQRAPSEWERTLAASLGLRFAELQLPDFQGWALYEPQHPERRGSATWLQRRRLDTTAPLGTLVTAAAPGWERGVLFGATALTLATGADGLLLHGALPVAVADGTSDARQVHGRRSFFQRNYETWINGGGTAALLRGIEGDEPLGTPLVATFDAEVLNVEQGPTWTRSFVDLFEDFGLEVAAFDGTAERAAFSASSDPLVAFGRRFAPDSTFVLWLRSDFREHFSHTITPRSHRRRLERLPLPRFDWTLSAFALHRRACFGRAPRAECERLRPAPECSDRALTERLQRYQLTRNPLSLIEVVREGNVCGLTLVAPPGSDTLWLAFSSYPSRGRRIESFFPLVGELWATEPSRVELTVLEQARHLPFRPLFLEEP